MKAFLVPGATYTLDTDEWQGGGHEAGAGGPGGAGGEGGAGERMNHYRRSEGFESY